jgi:hypothetical protein
MRAWAWAEEAPSDIEAAAFARGALYVVRYAPPPERIQRAEEAIALAEKVVAADLKHRGGIHYLIHATDSPRFAEKGLAAARAYDKLAPAADDALHMPSHIFLQLGMWPDVSASNERAWAASRTWVARGTHPVTDLGWHSLQWLEYSYLQEGRYRQARELIESAREMLAPASADILTGYPDARYAVETMEFQYAAETGDWTHFPGSKADVDALAARSLTAPSLREQSQALSAAYHAAAAVLGQGDAAGTRRAVRAISRRHRGAGGRRSSTDAGRRDVGAARGAGRA